MNLQDVYSQVEACYEKQDYLDAYEICKELWEKPEILPELDAKGLLLAARLASVLGASKGSNFLRREAVRRYPDDPSVLFYCMGHIRKFRNLYGMLRHYEDNPFQPSDDPYTDGLCLTHRAVSWAYVRDFKRAHQLMDEALGFTTDTPWLHYSRSAVFLLEEKPEEALREAELTYSLVPRAPYAMGILSSALAKMHRYEEAAERSWSVVTQGDPQTFQLLLMALRNIGVICDRQETSSEWSSRMLEICEGLERTAPLADSRTKRDMALVRIDTLRLNGQIDKAAEVASTIYHPFYDKAFKHYRDNPDGSRVVITHNPVIQDREHCLPASVSVALSHFGHSLSQHDMAKDVTFGGTPIWDLTRWLRKRDYQVVNFIVTEQTARTVLEAGLPFVLHQMWDSGAHSVTAVGYDDQLGLLQICDPNSPRLSEMIASAVSLGEEPIGCLGTLVAPAETPLPSLPSRAVELAEAYHEYYRQQKLYGNEAAADVIATLGESYPDHPLYLYFKAIVLSGKGQNSEALELFRGLHEKYPLCVYFRRGLVNVLRTLENSALMREVLREIITDGSVCGVKPDSSYKFPMLTYKCQYADYLRQSAKTYGQAYRYALAALREDPTDAEPYHILADTLLCDDRQEEAVMPLRVAARLQPANEHYATGYFHLQRRSGDIEGALEFMHERAVELGRNPRGIDAWDSYVCSLEAAGRPAEALAQMHQLLDFHKEVPEALALAGSFFARAGEWELAMQTVEKLKAGDNESFYLSTAVDVFWRHRDLKKAYDLACQWITAEPINYAARDARLNLLGQLEGNEKSLALAETWYTEHSDNELFENIYFNWLDRLSSEDKKIKALNVRVKRNPLDAWAWRELAFEYANELSGSSGDKHDEFRKHFCHCIEQCQQLSPGAVTIALGAMLAEMDGESDKALGLWFDSIEEDPGYTFAIRRAYDLSYGMGEEVRKSVYARLRKHILADKEIPDVFFLQRVAGYYGLEEVAGLLEELEERHKESPDLIECRADLVLNYAIGMEGKEKDCLGSLADIRAMLEAAVGRYPTHRGICLSLVDLYVRNEDFAQAESVLENHLVREMADIAAMHRLADIYHQTDRPGECRKMLELCVERCPGEGQAWYRLATFLAEEGDPGYAMKVFSQGLEKLPEHVGLREKAISFFIYYGADELAVDIARQGTEIFPDGSYMWFLYGKTLFHAERTNDNTDPVMPLRKALEQRSTLYEAAFTLSTVLASRKQFDEAQDVLTSFCEDPENRIFALAQKAMIKRTMGSHHSDEEAKKEATRDMWQIIQDAPDYVWGWERFLEWVEKDEDWDIAREALDTVPPAMRGEPDFRVGRLRVLRAAGVEDLDRDWDLLMKEFPRNAYIANERFDLFWDMDKCQSALTLLEDFHATGNGSLWTEIRLAMAYRRLAQPKELLEVASRLWVNQEDLSNENDEAASFVWSQIVHSSDETRRTAKAELFELLGGPTPVRPGAIRELCEHTWATEFPECRSLMLRIQNPPNAPFWKKIYSWLNITLCYDVASLRKDLTLHILHRLSRTNWAQGYHFSEVLLGGSDFTQLPTIADELLKLRPGIENECADIWGALGYAYSHDERQWVLKNMANWRERPGAKFWQITNYLIAHFKAYPHAAQQRLDDCAELLTHYQHAPNTARFVAWLGVDSALRAGQYQQSLEIYHQYQGYLDRETLEHEFMSENCSYMPEVLPMFIELMQNGWSKGLNKRFKKSMRNHNEQKWIHSAWTNVRDSISQTQKP